MAEVKVQAVYERALSLLGKTEEGTDYPFADRAPALLNTYIHELNLFRDEENQISPVETMQSVFDISEKEALALAYCLAAVAGSEAGIPELSLKVIFDTHNRLMGSFTTGFEDIPERYLR
ncbi:MAG: hypothetical protein U0M15_02255 [Bacillota bacterium]|nr:hypothetical protein [Bacillota bacterium]